MERNQKQFLEIKNFINSTTCEKIKKEINKFNKFDDLVMSGRKRINKGSTNFTRFLKKSKNAGNFFNKINNLKFYKNINSMLGDVGNSNNTWSTNLKKIHYSRKIFGAQSGNKITSSNTNIKKNILYLDMDFSVSDRGYNRGPHRDRESRVINFLIYLNTLKKEDGGKLFFYKVKKRKNFRFPRFPNIKNLLVSKSIPAKKGVAIFFPSNPESYHAVSKFKGKKVKKRYFIYGSFSLNKAVNWKKYKSYNARAKKF